MMKIMEHGTHLLICNFKEKKAVLKGNLDKKGVFVAWSVINPLRPNNDESQTSHCNIKGVSVSEVMRIKNMITQVKFY